MKYIEKEASVFEAKVTCRSDSYYSHSSGISTTYNIGACMRFREFFTDLDVELGEIISDLEKQGYRFLSKKGPRKLLEEKSDRVFLCTMENINDKSDRVTGIFVYANKEGTECPIPEIRRSIRTAKFRKISRLILARLSHMREQLPEAVFSDVTSELIARVLYHYVFETSYKYSLSED